MSDSSFLGMSDEDFLKQAGPEGGEVAPAEGAGTPAADATEAQPQVATPEQGEPEEQAPATTSAEEPPAEDAPPSGSTPAEAASPDADAAAQGNKQATAPEAGAPKDAPTASVVEAPDYEGFYKQVMAPFKANGKTIELRSPQEAVQLMQMGANYTRKMQELAPHRKVLLMLENNGLLDEGKLSFAIDLIEKKNPEAIRKLVKDSGIDPMEIDTSVEPAYRAGSHQVSDEEAAFRTALDEMRSSESGVATLKLIHSDWDDASKDVLLKSPEVLGIIHEQRENGIYDRISAEVNRRRTLGTLSPATPFLQAYKAVGDEMVAANAFADLAVTPAANKPAPNASPSPQTTAPAPASRPPAVVATRVATPKPAVANSDRATAASPSRTTPKPARTLVNPLAMSDEEFLRQMDGRV